MAKVSIMQFKRVIRNKVYPTWTAKHHDLRIHVNMLVVTEVFHFTVVKNGKTLYSSLDHNMFFTEFDETVQAVEQWVKINYTEDKEDNDI
jgi:hypothetical protein